MLNIMLTAADAKAAQETNPSQDRLSFASADNVPQPTADSDSGGEGARTSGSLQQQQAPECDPDPPECSPADDESGATDAQQAVSIIKETAHPADDISAAKTVRQTSPVIQQVPQTDAEPVLDRPHAAVQHKADAASGSKEHGASQAKSHASSPQVVLMTRGAGSVPVCQHGSQASLSKQTSGTKTASEPAAGMTTDVELADKENDSSLLSAAASDTPSGSQGLKEVQQGAAAAAAAQVVIIVLVFVCVSASGSVVQVWVCVWIWLWVWVWVLGLGLGLGRGLGLGLDLDLSQGLHNSLLFVTPAPTLPCEVYTQCFRSSLKC